MTRTATLALLAATAVWGATFVTVKDALASSDSFTFLALRFAVGAVSALLISLVLERPTRAQWESVLRPGLLLGVILFGGYALQTVGLETTTPARSAFLTGLTVIFVPFVSWKLSGQRPPVRAFLASAIALVGLQRLTGVSFDGAVPAGDVLTLGCAILYAGHIVGTSKLGQGLPSLALTSLQLAVVSVLSAASLPFVARKFEPTSAYWGAVLFTGIVASAVAIGVQVWAQTKLSAVRASVIYSLEPVFAIAWAVITGLGWPSGSELVGGAFILAAVFVSEVEFGFLRGEGRKVGA